MAGIDVGATHGGEAIEQCERIARLLMDPGADDVPAGKITAAKFEAMGPTAQAEWIKAHGADSVIRETKK